MKELRLRFPQGFLWGTASSSYQCEGGNTNSQWYKWEQEGRILSGEVCGLAANWWEDAEADFGRAEQLENTALRLSLEWSRIEPREGEWDHRAIERYREMLLDLKRRHMIPVVTLHHFSDPFWFAERGGFLWSKNIAYFLRYVSYVVKELGDVCTFWVTLNEPNVYAMQGYLLGAFPPGEKDLLHAFTVLRNMLQAHVGAFYRIRSLQPSAQIGYCLHYRLFDPLNPLSPLDRGSAKIQEQFFNWSILEAAESGSFGFPAAMFLPSIKGAAGARDYHGINYYTREMVRFDASLPAEGFGVRQVKGNVVRNDEGLDASFGEIYAEGLGRVLEEVYRRTRGNKPLYITENGFSDREDSRRPRALLEHLVELHRAIQRGIPVKGYFHWSLVDNFEWNNGWYVRFGLIEVDPLSQERLPRRSASMYGEICRANAITEDIVERYAPEALESLFGSQSDGEKKGVSQGKKI